MRVGLFVPSVAPIATPEFLTCVRFSSPGMTVTVCSSPSSVTTISFVIWSAIAIPATTSSSSDRFTG